MKRFLITGGNLGNKGAESMLLITINEIKKVFPDSQIYIANMYGENFSHISAIDLNYSIEAQAIALGKSTLKVWIRCILKSMKRVINGKPSKLFCEFDAKKIFPELTAVLDISGYSIGEKWDILTQERYINNIKLEKKFAVPIYLLPQSFGPFNYSKDKKYLLNMLADVLPYSEIIFAREKQGKEMLEKKFGLNNVILSSDLVLQTASIQLDNVFNDIPDIKLPNVCLNNNVGIVPNKQCFNHGNDRLLFEIYRKMIECLIISKKNVYLFRHSSEDLDFCLKIKEMFQEVDSVVVLDNNFNCIEYDKFVQNFDFLICSRYHGIVHAYKNKIPCIALGWAEKYTELAEIVSQERFAFNIVDDSIDLNQIEEALNDMLVSYEAESQIISKKVEEIQKCSCFEFLKHLSQ